MGTFIKRYNVDFEFQYTASFTDKDGDVVFATGKTDSGIPLIMKTDVLGNTLWAKKYDIGGTFEKGIEKIIRLDEYRYIAYMQKDLYYHVFMLIDADGNIISGNEHNGIKYIYKYPASKVFLISQPPLRFAIIESPTEFENFFHPRFSVFNENFEFQYGYTIDEAIVISAVDKIPNGLSFAGRYQNNNDCILFFDKTRFDAGTYNRMLKLHNDMAGVWEISDIKITEYTTTDDVGVLISGKRPSISGINEALFIQRLEINLNINGEYPSSLYILPDSSTDSSSLSDGYYLTQYNKESQKNILHHFELKNNSNFGLNLLWSKRLDISQYINTNDVLHRVDIMHLGFDPYGDYLVTNINGESFVIKTNTDFESDITVELPHTNLDLDGEFIVSVSSFCMNDCVINLYDGIQVVTSSIDSEINPFIPNVTISSDTIIQSQYVGITAAGSMGSDGDGSTAGVHLRWNFAGELGYKHLPKGNYASTNYNFNKTDDYVYIYRTKYVPTLSRLALSNQNGIPTDKPISVLKSEAKWIYKIGNNNDKIISIVFKDKEKYQSISIDPLVDPNEFIKQYGSSLIEIQSGTNLFFAFELNVEFFTTDSVIRIEALSVLGSNNTIQKTTTVCQKLSGSAINGSKFYCENGQTIRFEIIGAKINYIDFEFYEDVIKNSNQAQSWKELGKFALTLNDSLAYSRLEPKKGMVHSKWPRYDDEFVNINNYQSRWNREILENDDLNLKQIIQNYIQLSNSEDNPKALYDIGNSVNDETSYTIPLLDVINISAMDFHVARMVGLGTLDFDDIVASVSDKFIYLLKYISIGDLNETNELGSVQHLSLSLPTSREDQRLPLSVSINEINPGIITESDEDNSDYNFAFNSGYAPDGHSRFVTLIAEGIPDLIIDKSFFYGKELNASEFTFPLYAGLKYSNKQPIVWEQPELSHDSEFMNVDGNGEIANFETIPLVMSESKNILYVHQQKNSGTHSYNTYGINIFSRSSELSQPKSIFTELKPINLLKSPTSINALLIREEDPLLFSSSLEQEKLRSIETVDKTLIRLIFEYNAQNEIISYLLDSEYETLTDQEIENDMSIFENNEIFAENVEIFFRNSLPISVSGKIKNVYNDTDPLVSVVETEQYIMSTGQILVPCITQNEFERYAGGVFVLNDKRYVIKEIIPSNVSPTFKVYKEKVSEALFAGDILNEISLDTQNLGALDYLQYDLFSAMENMQNVDNWDLPLTSKTVKIGGNLIDSNSNWKIKRNIFSEIDSDNSRKRYLQKIRGFFWEVNSSGYIEDIKVEKIMEEESINNITVTIHKGIYKMTISNFCSNYSNSSEWYNGQLQLKTNADDIRICSVLKTDITDDNNLIIYFADTTFESTTDYQAIEVNNGGNPLMKWINYSPGYKIYLFANQADKLTEKAILPAEGEGIKYSIFGLRTTDTNHAIFSGFSNPVQMFAQEIVVPKQPMLPVGAKYTTRPDSFGRAAYTIHAKFEHKPTSAMFYRCDDELLLNALYRKETVAYIRTQLSALGGNSEVNVNERWNDFLNFERTTSEYQIFPDEGFGFPLPDNPIFIDYINKNVESNSIISTVTDLLMEIPSLEQGKTVKVIKLVSKYLYSTFVSLTEFPVVYQYIKDFNNIPLPKKQKIKDAKGYLLSPSDPDFEMAPMARLSETDKLTVLFTDFTIDATSDNLYFYSTQEVNNLMKSSDFSKILGPIKPVNTVAPKTPDIKRIMPVLENQVLGVRPAIQFEINSYHSSIIIRKITLYRAFNMLEAQSVRTMTKVKEIDLEDEGILNNDIWTFYDEFDDLSEVPYSDALFYRITVSRRVEYDENSVVVTEYVPSSASKIIATIAVESSIPNAPTADYTYDQVNSTTQKLYNVTLNWEKTTYKGKYHLYKMNSQGNWEFVEDINNSSNDNDLSYYLGDIDLKDGDGNNIYAHYKIVAENTNGMLSTEENMVTIIFKQL